MIIQVVLYILFAFLSALRTSVFYHSLGLLSTPVEQKEEITVHQQACAVHQKVVDVAVLIFEIFDDPKHRNREAKPRGSKTEGDDQKQIDDHGQRTQVIGFVLVTMLDVEKFPH